MEPDQDPRGGGRPSRVGKTAPVGHRTNVNILTFEMTVNGEAPRPTFLALLLAALLVTMSSSSAPAPDPRVPAPLPSVPLPAAADAPLLAVPASGGNKTSTKPGCSVAVQALADGSLQIVALCVAPMPAPLPPPLAAACWPQAC